MSRFFYLSGICICVVLLFESAGWTQEKKMVGECTITYSVDEYSSQNASADLDQILNASFRTVYYKGNSCRIDFFSPYYSQTLLIDNLSGTAKIYKSFSSNHFLTILDSTQWKKLNEMYTRHLPVFSDETKTILGYTCKKAVIPLGNGSCTIYYTTDMQPATESFDYLFQKIPGFSLEFYLKEGNNVIHFHAINLDINPVPASRFEIKESDYRLLPFSTFSSGSMKMP